MQVVDVGLTGNSKYNGQTLLVEFNTVVEIPENGVIRREPSGTQWRQATANDYTVLHTMLITSTKAIPQEGENSGGNVNYYRVLIEHPQREEQVAYWAECGDIIRALNMTFDEGTVFKSLWRSAAERTLGLKKLGGDSIRDAEKMVHSSKLVLFDRKAAKAKAAKTLQPGLGIRIASGMPKEVTATEAPTYSNVGKVGTALLAEVLAPLTGGTNIGDPQNNTAIGAVSYQVGDADAN